MVTTWVIGLQGVQAGYNTAAFLRAGRLPDVATTLQHVQGGNVIDLATLYAAVRLEALSDARSTTFPLAVAEALVSIVLVVASAMAMSGRRGARTFAIQALLANAALTALEYALTRGVRSAWIDSLIRAAQTLPEALPAHEAPNRQLLMFFEGFRFFVLECVGLLGILALTRRRTKTYFDTVARMSEHADEP